jgi:ArsR family transcriptional regulator
VNVTQLPVRQRGIPCCESLIRVDPARTQETTEVLKALAEPTRLTMVAALWAADAPVCICDFTAAFDLSQATISHHMARLRDAGLVESEKRGIWIYYRLSDSLSASTRRLLEALTA